MNPFATLKRATLLTSALLSLSFSLQADVRLHGLFTDNMVLQRNASVPVWGWGDEGEEVKVSFRNQSVKTLVKGGKWMVHLGKLKAGGPNSLTVQGKNRIELKDVLVGEVWIASGQSNMEWPMSVTHNATNEIAKASNPQIRFYTVPKRKALQPTDTVPSSWQVCSPASARAFSAVAFYFGRDLEKALGVPIGLIHTSWGGSPAEVWMSEQALNGNPRYKTEILDGYQSAASQHLDALTKFNTEKAEAKASGKSFTRNAPGAPWRPTELYNGMIAPLIPFAFQGAIWYQGESNAGRAEQYRSLFPDMIRNWRKDWGQGDFPFLLVQLAPFLAIKSEPSESSWAELREAQWLSTTVLPKVGMAVITDVGDAKDIHPRWKEPVGARQALAARRTAYGQKIVYSGPEFRSLSVRGDNAVLRFRHTGSGLIAKGGELTGFTLAGEDHKFVKASARIEADTVVVSSPQISKPTAVRFGWADYPVVNLWNKEGLPAVPFRTDDLPMITAGKK